LNTSAVRNAILNRDIIEFTYHGYLRIAEPHVYGIKNGKRQILVYQVGGLTSSGKLPDWRRVNLDDISGFRVSRGQKFVPRDTRPPDQDDWDVVIAAVK
jgi:hypothetical protein